MALHGRTALWCAAARRRLKLVPLVWVMAGVAAGAGKPLEACRLLSASTLQSVQGSRPTAAVPSSRRDVTIQSSSCFYTLSPFNQSVNLEVMTAAGTADIHQFWKQRFHGPAETKEPEAERRPSAQGEANERHASPKPVPGVGEDAFWIYTGRDGALYALQRDYVVRVSVGGKPDQANQLSRATTLALSALKELARH
jgi:hypothetical protein